MKRMVVSIRDVKTGEYLGLVQVKNQAEAERSFLSLCMDPKSPMYRFPRDYHLHLVGGFDPETGKLAGVDDGVKDLTPYTVIDELVTKREAIVMADWKASEGMAQSVDYFKRIGNGGPAR